MKQLYCAMKRHELETERLVPSHKTLRMIVHTYIPAHLSVFETLFSIFGKLATSVSAYISSITSALVA